MEPVFVAQGDGAWMPSDYARGPFAGLQGGAVAGLMVHELERLAERYGLGTALSASVQFLRPVPVAPLTTEPEILRPGRRASVLRSELRRQGELMSVATVTFARSQDFPGIEDGDEPLAPERSDRRPRRRAPHGGHWFMDTMEARGPTDGIHWFRIRRPLVASLTPMARVLGPADWAHGLAAPPAPDLAFPNVDIALQLTRPPEAEWIGVRPSAHWSATGVGRGAGILYDRRGEIGGVSMGVALAPLPLRAVRASEEGDGS